MKLFLKIIAEVSVGIGLLCGGCSKDDPVSYSTHIEYAFGGAPVNYKHPQRLEIGPEPSTVNLHITAWDTQEKPVLDNLSLLPIEVWDLENDETQFMYIVESPAKGVYGDFSFYSLWDFLEITMHRMKGVETWLSVDFAENDSEEYRAFKVGLYNPATAPDFATAEMIIVQEPKGRDASDPNVVSATGGKDVTLTKS